jgi:hypothetical protein
MYYRIKWISGYYKHQGCSKPNFPFTIYNEVKKEDSVDKTNLYLKANIEAENEDSVKSIVLKYFPDMILISCKKVIKRKNKIFYLISLIFAVISVILWGIFSVSIGLIWGIGFKGLYESFKKIINMLGSGKKIIFKTIIRE